MNIIFCNSFSLNYFGLPNEKIINKPLTSLFKETKELLKITSALKKITVTFINDSDNKINFSISPLSVITPKNGYLLVGNLVKIKKEWDENLFQVLKESYTEVGEAFFKSITRSLAKVLGMKYAFIGEIANSESQKPLINTIAFWDGNKFKNNFTYELDNSPCENVINKKQVLVFDDVAKLYPKDKDLINLGVKSYIGTPIICKNGTPIGLLVVMDTKPTQISKEQASKLNLFASRVGTEMEWVKNDEQLKEQEQKFRTILRTLPNPVYVQNNEGIYEHCNTAFLNYFKLKRASIINKELDDLPQVIKNNAILSVTHNDRTKGINRIESNILCGNNTTKESIITKSPILDGNKTKVGIVGVIQDISEIKNAEKKLLLNEEKYRTLFNTANDAFLLMSKDTFIDCNQKALQMFGCSKERLIGSSPQLFSPNTQPDKQNSKTKVLQKINEAISGKAITFYWKHKKYNGQLFDAEVSLNTFYFKGELLIQAVIRDVSEKYKTSRAIEKQTLRMQKMYELTSDTHTPFKEKISGILQMATESLGMQLGGISSMENNQYKLLDYYSLIEFSSEDIDYLCQNYCAITIQENRLIAIPDFSKSIYPKSNKSKAFQLESYIGVPYWVRGKLRGTILFTSFYSVNEFKSYDSNFVQMIGQWIGSSIEREEYEENLLKNQALLSTLLREMPIDFSVRDANLKMLWQSNKSKEVWGDNEGKEIDFSDVDDASVKQWKDIFKRVLKGETIKGENDVKIYGKPYSLYSIASPIFVQGKVEQITIIHIDISQLKKAEKKLQSRNSKLKKLNAELDRFVYSASHDLRAPLASLLGLIDLSRREETTPLLSEYLTLMNKSITKLDSFISDITDYSRNLRLKTINKKIDFKTMAEELFSSLAYMSQDKIDFKVKVSGRANFYSDPDRLRLILNNLLSNSIRYRSKFRSLKIVLEVKKDKKQTIIKVIDNGIGIEKKYQAKIFEMFYRANDQNSGSGLGLFIVKETADKLKGKIQLSSALDQGTTITISLPNASA